MLCCSRICAYQHNAACLLRPSHMPPLIAARAPSPALAGSLAPAITSGRPRWARRRSEVSKRLVLRRARTESGDMELGTTAPDFELLDPAAGQLVSLAQIADGAQALLVMWWCNHCPFVKHLKEAVVGLVHEHAGTGLAAVAISSNSVETHPQDGPDRMVEDAKQFGYPFPYLYDETQEVARAYAARCTPEFYVFDRDLKLQYHGQFDSSRPSNGVPITGEDIRGALNDVLAGNAVQRPIKPSVGCSIKWHP